MTSGTNRRRGQEGFTLIELLIVVAIIGIIAAILVPNLIDALQKAKQKSTVADIRNIGTAWMSWVTDQVSAGAAGATAQQLAWATDLTNALTAAQLGELLEGDGDQFYLQRLPTADGWANALEFRAVFDPTDTGTYSNIMTSSRAVGIRSLGRDNTQEGSGTYTSGTFLGTDYDGDIVWSDGYFVRAPGGFSSSVGGS